MVSFAKFLIYKSLLVYDSKNMPLRTVSAVAEDCNGCLFPKRFSSPETSLRYAEFYTR